MKHVKPQSCMAQVSREKPAAFLVVSSAVRIGMYRAPAPRTISQPMAEASGDLDGEVELSLSLTQDARERSCSAGGSLGQDARERDDSAGGVSIAGRKTDAGDARCRGETGSNAQEHAARTDNIVRREFRNQAM